jgi:hypothetical protein
MSHFDLEHLLAPIGLSHFFQEYWEKKPLAIQRHQSQYYSGLFSSLDIESVLLFSHPRYPNVQMCQANGCFSMDGKGMKTRSIHDYGVPDLSWLHQTYVEGGTLFLDRLQDYWSPIAALSRALEQTLNSPVNTTAYAMNHNALGFEPHSHKHAVFVLQLEGSEVWRVQPPNSVESSSEILLETQMEPGDLLYIPRHYVHHALASEQSSLHLAIDVYVHTWADLVNSAISTLDKFQFPLHQSLPVGFLRRPETTSLMQTQLVQLLDALGQHAEASSAIAHLTSQFIGKMQPLADGHFFQLEQLNDVTLDSLVVKRQGMICRIFKSRDQVGIQFPGNQVTAPAYVEPILDFIIESAEFRVSELPDVLSDRSKLVLIRRLIREGLLAIASGNAITAGVAVESELP